MRTISEEKTYTLKQARAIIAGQDTRIRSGDEAVEKGRVGGKASGESRRRTADLKKKLQSLLDSNANTYGELPENPVFCKESADQSIQSAIICALIHRALKGDVSAINAIIKILGIK